MKLRLTLASACVALAATGAFADPGHGHCGKEGSADAMRARVETLNKQMDRAEWAADRATQRELMDLHTKHMREGLRELRKRDMPADCRVELMSEMMESMMRHHQLQEDGR